MPAVFYSVLWFLNVSFFDMSRLLGDPGVCRGQPFRDFVDIDVHFFIKSCSPEFYPRGFCNDLCLFSRSFFMMSRSLGEGHFGDGWCARYFCNSPCNPSGELGMSILTRCGHSRSCCFVTATPYGTLWVSTLISCHVFDVEVSEV